VIEAGPERGPALPEGEFMSAGPWQIVIIAVVILVLFGASRLGDIGKGLGEGIRNFKKGISDDGDDKGKTKKSDDDESDKA
jgi:sec-independent protein translocase protein TatA